jgi:hypothetical protein
VSTTSRTHRASFKAASAILLTLAMAAPAVAIEDKNISFDTTEDLFRVCSVDAADSSYTAAQVACTAFIEATVQYHDAVSDKKQLKRLICYPQGATIADGRAAFLAWAQTNAGDAKRMAEMPVVGLVRALAKTYPCK